MFGVISVWLVVQLFSLAALPLAWRLFALLPSRGYALAKALGLLLVSYALWLAASFRLLANSVGGILFALAIVVAISLWAGRDGLRREGAVETGRPLLNWLRDNRWFILSVELLFLVVLAGWAAFRAYNPDISGTEKPMELAFLNGVLGSRFFPPQDPWLSGYGISYYYFGYIVLGVITRLSGVGPAVAFNLGVALWCSLTAIGAFGVVFDLVQLASPFGSRQADPKRQPGRGIRYGLLAALFIAFLGNLEGVVELAYNRGLVPMSWIRWLDIKQLTDSPPTGNLTGGFWWWWHASRVIHDKDLLGNSVEVIDEFPFFSFLLGDMHPHVLALPFVLLAIGLAINLMLSASKIRLGAESSPSSAGGEHSRLFVRLWHFLGSLTGLGLGGLLLCSVVLGALAFLNTWDFPIYVGLAALAVGGGLALRLGLSWVVVGRSAATGAVLGVLGWLCYLPFYLGFQSQLGGVLPNLLFPSRLSQFLLVFGAFLAVVVFFFLFLSRSWASSQGGEVEFGANNAVERAAERSRSLLRCFLAILPWVILLPTVLWAALGLSIALLPQGRSLVQSLLNEPAVAANIGSQTVAQLGALVMRLRVGNPWVYLVLAGLIAWGLALICTRLPSGRRSVVDGGNSELQNASERGYDTTQAELVNVDTFALLMICTALILTLSVEFAYLRDLFGTRMNTVFKFYYQAWILLGLASAYGLSRLAARRSPGFLRWPALAVATLLVAGGLFYTVTAIPSKADNFQEQPTLDGLAYLRRYNPGDMAAIEWLRASVPPSATILEAAGGSYSPEGAGRVSMATGNPTLLGWDFHEMQWRGKAYEELAAGRPDAITQIYRTASPEDLPGLLDTWGIDYVYLGALERDKYKVSDVTLQRFDRMLNRVYDADGVIIYGR